MYYWTNFASYLCTDWAQERAGAGVRLRQYRNKPQPARELLDTSRSLASLLLPRRVFYVNDRPDVAVLAGGTANVGRKISPLNSSLVGWLEEWVGFYARQSEHIREAAGLPPTTSAVCRFYDFVESDPDPRLGTELILRVRDLYRQASSLHCAALL